MKGIDTFHVTPNPIDIILVGMDEARLRALIHTFVPSSTFESLVEMDEARLRALIHSKQIFCHPHQTSRNG